MALALFLISYIGIALGKIPGLAIDRVGIALLGAIAMVGSVVVTTRDAVQSIDLPTILLLYSLMVVSAQLRLGGFYTWSASRMLSLLAHPKSFLLVLMTVSALLSALLGSIANLIVIEQASRMDVAVRFREHARVGIPVTLISLIVLVAWGML